MLTVSALSALKHEISRGLIFRLWEVVGSVSLVLLFLGIELLFASIFAEGVVGGIIACLVVGVVIGLCIYASRKDAEEKATAEAKKQAAEQLESRVFASIVETGKAPEDIPWNDLEPALQKLSKQQAEIVPEESRKAAYEQFIVQHLPKTAQTDESLPAEPEQPKE